MDIQPIATLAAPLIALALGGLVRLHFFNQRPKLLAFVSQVGAVTVRPDDAAEFNVNIHTLSVRNAGGGAANNVRVTHSHLPKAFSVYPHIRYTVEPLQMGAADICFPKLVAGEEVAIAYLYYPPMTVVQMHTDVKSDEGKALMRQAFIELRRPKWLTYGHLLFAWLGVYFVLLGIFQAVPKVWSWAAALG